MIYLEGINEERAMLLIIGALIMDFIIIKAFIEPTWVGYTRTRQLLKKGQLTKDPIIGYNQKEDLDQRLQFAPVAGSLRQMAKNTSLNRMTIGFCRKISEHW